MAMVLMRLGDFVFSVPGQSYDRIHRRFEYRWEGQARVGRRIAQQFTGPGEELMDIRGIIYPILYGGYTQLNRMRDEAQLGLPLPLAMVRPVNESANQIANGVGYYLGPWCIRMIRDEQEFFHKNGMPRKVEFSVDLVSYGID